MKVELAIFIGKSYQDKSFDAKHLDIIEIKPEGFEWGTSDRERCAIVKADLTQEQIDQLLESEWLTGGPDNQQELVRYRNYRPVFSGNFKTATDALANDTDWDNRQFFSGVVQLPDGKTLSDPTREVTLTVEAKT
jgi:hypothetical protein